MNAYVNSGGPNSAGPYDPLGRLRSQLRNLEKDLNSSELDKFRGYGKEMGRDFLIVCGWFIEEWGALNTNYGDRGADDFFRNSTMQARWEFTQMLNLSMESYAWPTEDARYMNKMFSAYEALNDLKARVNEAPSERFDVADYIKDIAYRMSLVEGWNRWLRYVLLGDPASQIMDYDKGPKMEFLYSVYRRGA